MRTNDFNQSGRHGLLFKTSGALLVMLLCGNVYAAPPANDECVTATMIAPSAPTPPWTSSTDATDATYNAADPQLVCNPGGDGTQTVWYKYTPDTSRAVNINTLGSTEAGGAELDTAHGAYIGSCGALVPVACVDQGLTDELIMEVDAGVTYYIKVGQFNGGSDAGTVVLSVDELPEPSQLNFESVRDGVTLPFGLNAAIRSVASAGKLVTAPLVFEIPNMMPALALGNDLANAGQAIVDDPYLAKGDPSVLLQIFEGASNTDNGFTWGGLVAPPDTVGDVGPNHYVQMVNSITIIYDKSGNPVAGPVTSNTFFAGLGGQCETTNSGDPVVLFDEETQTWLVTQFASGNPQDGLCVAMSVSDDPTGAYYVHEFNFEGVGFPDYPKYGFSTDTINVMVNLFTPFQGAGLGAIDKAEAMSPNQTTMVFYIMGGSEFGFIPGDNDGPVFDNTKPTFFTNNGGSGDRIDVWEITPDYDSPADSTIAEVAKIPVAPWSSFLCDALRGRCIAQPGSGTGAGNNFIPWLEALEGRLMHRGQTRDFGKRKKALLSHTVAADENGKAGVHWYELWNDKDKGWKLKKEETFSPDGDNRWMGSIAMNAAGQTCLGYSISSETTYPSIGIAGRNGTANHMNVPELLAFDGGILANVQRRVARWGDYSAMSIDPVDDSCWYTTEYASPNPFIGEQFGWGTKVLQFIVPDDD